MIDCILKQNVVKTTNNTGPKTKGHRRNMLVLLLESWSNGISIYCVSEKHTFWCNINFELQAMHPKAIFLAIFFANFKQIVLNSYKQYIYLRCFHDI